MLLILDVFFSPQEIDQGYELLYNSQKICEKKQKILEIFPCQFY